jgi:hypothetical protein
MNEYLQKHNHEFRAIRRDVSIDGSCGEITRTD